MTSVALLIDQLFATAPGGIGTYIRRLVPAMSRAEPSLEVTLFHSRFSDGEPEGWTGEYRVEELPASIRSLYPAWALARRPPLPPTLASLDVVHSPSPAAVPPAGPGQRLVVTVHDLAFLVHPELFPRQWRLMYRAALFRAARSADAIITVSRYTAEELAQRTRTDPRRIHVVPLAGSTSVSDAKVEQVLTRLKVRQPYILFVGTLEPRKNLVRLVRAYRLLAAQGASHALVLAGPLGWHRQTLLAEIAREGAGEVILTGPLTSGDLDGLYKGAAVFAYPSLYEGFGLPVLEAMARGVPCLVSAASSLPEVAGNAALFADPRSVASLFDGLERLTTDLAFARRLVEGGLARAAGFSWDETARGTLDVYQSLG